MRLIESAAPDGPLETVVPSCLHGRVSSPHREETPTEESLDPGLLMLSSSGPMDEQLRMSGFQGTARDVFDPRVATMLTMNANPWKDSIASSSNPECVDQDGLWLVAAGVGEASCTMSERDDGKKKGEDMEQEERDETETRHSTVCAEREASDDAT